METGTSGLQLRVRDFVRKLRPERVRWQWRHLLASVDNHWPASTTTDSSVSCDSRSDTQREGRAEFEPVPSSDCDLEVAEITAATQTRCKPSAADQLMSSLSQLPVTSTDEELSKSAAIAGNGGGSVRPCELSLGGGGLVPPASTPRNKSPVTVQEWVDSLPLTPTDTDGQVNRAEEETEPRIVLTQDSDDNLTLGAEAGLMCGPLPPAVQVTSHQEPSESDSHCSSVESLLEARRPDPEEVLFSLGFGGAASSECRIPQRFLQPSKLKGVAIDDFLRHQQEVVTNFETGFYGYRGLSGPSHTMPSVIVAKIMEKLREHERENCSVASPPHVSTNTDRNNRFTRAARNVITNLKSPGNSVLTPDNRAWLDSQNQRSPEVSRKRIIIGQQSFTFSRDGDLIESPPSSLTDSDSRWTSSTGTPGLQKNDLSLDKPSFPSIQEAGEPAPPSPPTTVPRHAFANIVTTLLAEKNQESKLSSSSMEARSLGDSGVGLPSSGRSSRGVDEFDSPDYGTRTGAVTVEQPLPETPSSLEVFPSPDSSGSTETANAPSESQETVLNESFLPSISVDETLASEFREIDSSLDSKNDQPNSSSIAHISQVELLSEACNDEETSIRLGSDFYSNTNLPTGNPSISDKHSEKSVSVTDSNVLEKASVASNSSSILERPKVYTSLQSFDTSTSCTSPFPSLASELEQAQLKEQEKPPVVNRETESQDEEESHPSTSAPVRVIESLDKVIESLEKIMEPLEVITESSLQFNSAIRSQSDKEKLVHSFEDLRSLAKQLVEAKVPVEIGSCEHFLNLTINERCELQCRVVRLALSSYQSHLAQDTSHYELKCCLSVEVSRLSDLLDTASDPDMLNTLVKQMTELLKHQAELSKELDQWMSQSAEEAPGCHQLCEVVLRRLRALELLVHRNTQALSDLRNQVSH
ncbi:uncharacterized protein LOC129004296 [Macrosteles quadrilineatus]|uniref:uncharacterized protein LOC129004296 n=1 Tax=Macrosteles quadrilineatus TaxID=74068 RepID=UPI0023E30DA8|nr:uncharacterized protein LOC129004296 [Macrosteles quadrilineatus]